MPTMTQSILISYPSADDLETLLCDTLSHQLYGCAMYRACITPRETTWRHSNSFGILPHLVSSFIHKSFKLFNAFWICIRSMFPDRYLTLEAFSVTRPLINLLHYSLFHQFKWRKRSMVATFVANLRNIYSNISQSFSFMVKFLFMWNIFDTH
jgi:hypothetical protein